MIVVELDNQIIFGFKYNHSVHTIIRLPELESSLHISYYPIHDIDKWRTDKWYKSRGKFRDVLGEINNG